MGDAYIKHITLPGYVTCFYKHRINVSSIKASVQAKLPTLIILAPLIWVFSHDKIIIKMTESTYYGSVCMNYTKARFVKI